MVLEAVEREEEIMEKKRSVAKKIFITISVIFLLWYSSFIIPAVVDNIKSKKNQRKRKKPLKQPKKKRTRPLR